MLIHFDNIKHFLRGYAWDVIRQPGATVFQLGLQLAIGQVWYTRAKFACSTQKSPNISQTSFKGKFWPPAASTWFLTWSFSANFTESQRIETPVHHGLTHLLPGFQKPLLGFVLKKKQLNFKAKKICDSKKKSCLVEGIFSGILTVSHLSGPQVAGWTIWRYDDMICRSKTVFFGSDLLDPVGILLGFLDAVVAWVQNHSNTTQHSKVSMNPHQLSQPPHRGFQSPSICQALPGSYRQIRYHHNWKKRKTENQQSR